MTTTSTSVLRSAGALAVGVAAGYQLLAPQKQDGSFLRPPGALHETEFSALCIRCGKCGLACPYRVVLYHDIKAGATPYIDAREGACRLCEDFPCIEACPTGALIPVEDKTAVRMGVAVLDRDLCIALDGFRCEVCYRVCPLIDKAIYIKYSMREGDNTHAIFEPVIDGEHCVGCGLCVERCVISKPRVAIYVRPRGEEK